MNENENTPQPFGEFYGVGVGPGETDLITVKALKILNKVSLIAVPKSTKDKDSIAFSIVSDIIDTKKEVIELTFPMSKDIKVLEDSWKDGASKIEAKLQKGLDVAFITLGDPLVYSTFMYINKILIQKGYSSKIIPGVTSFCACAAKAGISLGENNEKIAIIPDISKEEDIDNIFKSFDTIILMKVTANFLQIKQKIKEHQDIKKYVLVSRCGLSDEFISYDLDEIDTQKLSYFSTMIIKKNGV